MKPSFFDRMRATSRTLQTNDDDFWAGVRGATLFVFDETTDAAIDALLEAAPVTPSALPFRRIFIEDERLVDAGVYIESESDGGGRIYVVSERKLDGYGANVVCDFDISRTTSVEIEVDGAGGKMRFDGLPPIEMMLEKILSAGGDPSSSKAVWIFYQTLARLNLIMMPSSLVEHDEIDARQVNRRRRLMKRPPITDRTIIRIKPGVAARIRERSQGGRHEPSRPLHAVRGHLRRLRSGRTVTVRPHRRGDARFGVRLAEYHVTGNSTGPVGKTAGSSGRREELPQSVAR